MFFCFKATKTRQKSRDDAGIIQSLRLDNKLLTTVTAPIDVANKTCATVAISDKNHTNHVPRLFSPCPHCGRKQLGWSSPRQMQLVYGRVFSATRLKHFSKTPSKFVCATEILGGMWPARAFPAERPSKKRAWKQGEDQWLCSWPTISKYKCRKSPLNKPLDKF